MYKTDKEIKNRLAEHYDIVKKHHGAEYTILGIFLQGSQNYGTSSENSDVDTKAILIPTYRTMVTKSNLISTTIELENGEHINVKDIRTVINEFKKPTINSVEWLYTKYAIVNAVYSSYVRTIRDAREAISTIDGYKMMNAALGHISKSYSILQKADSESDKWYKAYADIMRLYNFINLYPYYGFKPAIRNVKGVYSLQHIRNVKFNHTGIDKIITIDMVVDSAKTIVNISTPPCLSKDDREECEAWLEYWLLSLMNYEHGVGKWGPNNKYFHVISMD